MKKIFTLLVSVGALTSVFAQGQHDSRGQSPKYEQPSYPSHDVKAVIVKADERNVYNMNDYSFNNRERDQQIMKINREFDGKISTVKNKRFLRPQDKRRQIDILERQRSDEIRKINERFSNSRNGRYDDHNSRPDNRKW